MWAKAACAMHAPLISFLAAFLCSCRGQILGRTIKYICFREFFTGSCHKRQRRKRQSVTAKREKSQTPKVLTAILTLPNLTYLNLI